MFDSCSQLCCLYLSFEDFFLSFEIEELEEELLDVEEDFEDDDEDFGFSTGGGTFSDLPFFISLRKYGLIAFGAVLVGSGFDGFFNNLDLSFALR